MRWLPSSGEGHNADATRCPFSLSQLGLGLKDQHSTSANALPARAIDERIDACQPNARPDAG
jgi:hypothetical protein